jgi:hypothetical protein
MEVERQEPEVALHYHPTGKAIKVDHIKDGSETEYFGRCNA